MKLSTTLWAITATGHASASVLSVAMSPIGEAFRVPGLLPPTAENAEEAAVMGPLKLTNCGVDNDLAQINDVVITPNPPELGKQLTIKLKGELKKQVENGAIAQLHLKSGIIKFNKDFDLCTLLTSTDIRSEGDSTKCPIAPGHKEIVKHIDLPDKKLPPFIKHIEASLIVKNGDGNRIGCYNALWQRA